MNPRRLNRLIHILKPHKKKDDQTGEETVEYKRHHRKVPAAYEEVSGGTTRRGLQVEANVNSVLTIRYLEDIQDDYQIELANETGKGKKLEIVSMPDRDGRGEWLEVHCSEVV